MLLLETNTNVHSPRRKLSGSKDKPARVDSHHSGSMTNINSSTRLRSNLLRKLGIPPSSTTTASLSDLKQTKAPRGSLLRNANVERIPLKTDEDPSDNSSPPCSSGTSKVFQAWGSLWTGQPAATVEEPLQSGSLTSHTSILSDDHDERRVHFNDHVQVALIPTRQEYSSRIRRFLWDTPVHMQQQIVRNTLEFTADGWDWQTSLEETEHYFNPHSNEYIHPVHLEIAQMPPEEQELLVPRNYVNPALMVTAPTVPS